MALSMTEGIVLFVATFVAFACLFVMKNDRIGPQTDSVDEEEEGGGTDSEIEFELD